jgi:hypothetical protein
METQEPDIVRIDKKYIEKVKSYYSGDSLTQDKVRGLYTHEGKHYLVLSLKGDVCGCVEVIKSDIQGLTHHEASLMRNYFDGYCGDWKPSAELLEKYEILDDLVEDIDQFYLGISFTYRKEQYLIIRDGIEIHAKETGNEVQEEWAWARNEQEEMKL